MEETLKIFRQNIKDCRMDEGDAENNNYEIDEALNMLNKLEQQLTIPVVVSSAYFEKPTFQEMREEVLSNKL